MTQSDANEDLNRTDATTEAQSDDKHEGKVSDAFARLKARAATTGRTVRDRALCAAGAVKEGTTTAGKAVTKHSLSAGGAVADGAGAAGKVIMESNIGKAAVCTSEEVGRQLDTITGAAILKLVEERLELQARYNDILATKLDEALKRVEILERPTPFAAYPSAGQEGERRP